MGEARSYFSVHIMASVDPSDVVTTIVFLCFIRAAKLEHDSVRVALIFRRAKSLRRFFISLVLELLYPWFVSFASFML